MKILVTGGMGFIGSHLCEKLKEKYEVTVIDDFSGNKIGAIPGIRVVNGSILDKKLLKMAADGCEVIVHLAAMVDVGRCEKEPKECGKVNVEGTKNVLEIASEIGAWVVFASSAAVYGNQPVPHREDMVLKPAGVYGKSKLEGEELCRKYMGRGLKVAVLRFFNVYGPRQGGVIGKFIENSSKGLPLTINGDGNQTRDFVFVEDVVGVIEFVIKKKLKGGGFNVGTGTATRIKELAELIKEITKSSSTIKFGKERKEDVKESVADITKIKKLGWEPKYSLKKGLGETINWFQKT